MFSCCALCVVSNDLNLNFPFVNVGIGAFNLLNLTQLEKEAAADYEEEENVRNIEVSISL
jgi:hypothetical protein